MAEAAQSTINLVVHMATISGGAASAVTALFALLHFIKFKIHAPSLADPQKTERLRAAKKLFGYDPTHETLDTSSQRYHHHLGKILDWATRFYGGPPGDLVRPYGMSVFLGTVYASLLFINSWSITGDAKFGSFSATNEEGQRWQGIALLALSFALMLYLANPKKIVDTSQNIMKRRFNIKARVDTVAGAFAVTFAGAGAGTVAGAGAGAVAVAGAIAGAVAGVGVVAVAVASGSGSGSGSVVYSTTGIGSFIFGFVEGEADLMLLGLFLGFLPLINGYWDCLSQGISRTYSTPLRHDGGWRHLFWSLCQDLLLAFACLLGLAFSLGATLQGFSLAYQQPDVFHPRDMLSQVQEDPFGNGFWLTAMVLTTLLPTLVHIVAALFGCFFWRYSSRNLYPRLHRLVQDEPDLEQEERSLTRQNQARLIFWDDIKDILSGIAIGVAILTALGTLVVQSDWLGLMIMESASLGLETVEGIRAAETWAYGVGAVVVLTLIALPLLFKAWSRAYIAKHAPAEQRP